MRSLGVLAVLLLVAVACGGGVQELATTRPGEAEAPPVAVESESIPPSTSTSTSTSTTAPISVATTTSTLPALLGFDLQVVADGLGFPVSAKPIPGTTVVAVVSKDGRVIVLDGAEQRVWMDIGDRVTDRGEQGLLDLEFSPDFTSSGRFFVHYTDRSGDTVLSEFIGDAGSGQPDGEAILYRAAQPAGNHNGGSLEFGPDGSLFLALGDGGGANDQFGQGQRSDTPLGALLRFDVSRPGVATPAPGNPFDDGPAPEVWAFGLRNPWKITFDDPTNTLVIADVGQNQFEEINVVNAGVPGLNYGWPVAEGLRCFSPRSGCDTTGMVVPAVEVSHADAGTCSITGGVVYRGDAIPELVGMYLYSDYCGGWLRAMPLDDPTAVWDLTDSVGGPVGSVTGFGSDATGEVLILTADGRVLRLVAQR